MLDWLLGSCADLVVLAGRRQFVANSDRKDSHAARDLYSSAEVTGKYALDCVNAASMITGLRHARDLCHTSGGLPTGADRGRADRLQSAESEP